MTQENELYSITIPAQILISWNSRRESLSKKFKKEGANTGFLDKGVHVTQPSMDQMTWNFACRGFCVLLLSFGQVKGMWPL